MILNCTQWQRLQDNVREALPWLEKKGLLKDHLETLKRIADASLHDIMQVRTYEDWDSFNSQVPNPLPLEMVMNFGNWTNYIPFPSNLETISSCLLTLEEKGYVGWIKNWMFGDKRKYSLHRTQKIFGGMIFLHDETKPIGIMVADRKYIPISIEF